RGTACASADYAGQGYGTIGTDRLRYAGIHGGARIDRDHYVIGCGKARAGGIVTGKGQRYGAREQVIRTGRIDRVKQACIVETTIAGSAPYGAGRATSDRTGECDSAAFANRLRRTGVHGGRRINGYHHIVKYRKTDARRVVGRQCKRDSSRGDVGSPG